MAAEAFHCRDHDHTRRTPPAVGPAALERAAGLFRAMGDPARAGVDLVVLRPFDDDSQTQDKVALDEAGRRE